MEGDTIRHGCSEVNEVSRKRRGYGDACELTCNGCTDKKSDTARCISVG